MEPLSERLTDYLANCRETRALFQQWSEAHEQQANRTHSTTLVSSHLRQAGFWAAQACAYRDVITNLERLLGVEP